MDEFLNELYGTSQIINGDDVEKQAAAEFLIKLAEQEGVDLDTLSDAEVGDLLAEIEKQGSAQAQAQAQPQAEAQEKLAEADFLGRAMAHAYVNELHEIEKQAKAPVMALGEHLGKTLKKKGLGAAAGELGRSQVQALKSGGSALKSLITGKAPEAAGKGAKGLTIAKKKGESVRGAALRALGHSAQLASPTLAAGGLAAGGTALAMKKKSFDEQFENMARERAYEMLAEAGYDVEKVAQGDIESRALQMLEQAGYPVQWG
jgi:hypothetical protein